MEMMGNGGVELGGECVSASGGVGSDVTRWVVLRSGFLRMVQRCGGLIYALIGVNAFTDFMSTF